MEFKAISDELTTEEFNAIVSMFRHFKTIKKPLRINEQVLGDYGTYNFNMDGVTFVDNGILITNETIHAEPSVMLTDNQFTHSTYTLTLQVLHNTSLNILDDYITDFKVVETLDLELIPDEEITIPVDELEQGYIISFDSFIEIKHDKTIMQGEIPDMDTIVLSSDKSTTYINSPVNFTAAYTDGDGNPIVNELIRFKNGDTQIGQGYTDNQGIATLEYTPQSVGVLNVTASCGDVSSNVVVVTVEQPTFNDMTLTSNKDILSYVDSDTATLSAQLMMGDEPASVSGQTVTFEVRKSSDDSLVETLTGTTNNTGLATVSYVSKGTGEIYIKAQCMNLIQTYSLIDAFYVNDGSHIRGLNIQNGVSCTSDGEYITITTSTSGEKYVNLPVNISSSDNFEISLKYKVDGSNTQIATLLLLNENSFSPFSNVYMNINTGGVYSKLDGGTAKTVSFTPQNNDKLTLRRENEVWSILINDTVKSTTSYTWSGTKTLGMYTNRNRVQIIKDIVIKPL